ncbi:uncharacterized protein LOC144564014 [Carex rostrata]
MDFANSWPNSLHLCLYTLLIILSSLLLPSASVATNVSCLPDQSSSLLQLKRGFFYSDLTSWQPGTDCCHGWEGVSCDKATGHVTALDISNRNIEGNLNAAIFNLTSVQHLNLAYNDFSQNQIPTNGFEKLTMLTHLNLSRTFFFGQIPIAIANLTNLISLDLSNNDLKLHEPNLQVLVSQLSNLRELYLDGVDISENGTEWCRALSKSVPHLQVLSMVGCNLSGPIEPSLSQLGSLTVLRLSSNSLKTQIPDYFAEFPLKELLLENSDLEGTFPHEIFQIPTLTKLDLSLNGELFGTLPNFPIVSSLESLVLDETNFSGSIPDSIGNLRNLSELSLFNCNFSGQIPSSIKKLGKLATLDLPLNSLSGSIPLSLFSLPNLEELYLSNNKLSGQFRLKESSFQFSPLIELDLSENQLDGPIPNSIVCLPSLIRLDLSSNNFNGTFDFNLLSCNLSQIPNLGYVDLSKNQLHGAIPRMIWEWFGSIGWLDLSHNMFTSVEYVPPGFSFFTVDFSYNKLKGAVPLVDASHLDYSNNEFSEIPSSICELNISTLDLSNNNLSGSIPSCIIGSRDMQLLSLRGNKISGILSRHISRSCELIVLDLNNNNLEGNLPRSLTNCKDLVFLDIGNNHIGGTFPFSLGKLPKLQVIILSSNRFYDADGSLPYLEQNLIPLTIDIVDKGVLRIIQNKIADLMILIDLSSNRFSGDIPEIIGELKGIKALNLSHNALTGSIPNLLGCLTQIESLDLSWNQLSGEIPQELISLNFLSTLNLSFNQLVGGIPQSGQFLAFDNSSFEGNPGLCGMPLSKLCNVPSPENNSTSPPTKPAKKMTAIVLLCLFVGLGFGTGFGTGFAIVIIGPKIKRARNEHATR